VIAFNYHGFYEPLKALLDHYVRTGMMDSASRDMISFPETVAQVETLLR
jgi:predicted Rossmann-fold nucleotide-binding protein